MQLFVRRTICVLALAAAAALGAGVALAEKPGWAGKEKGRKAGEHVDVGCSHRWEVSLRERLRLGAEELGQRQQTDLLHLLLDALEALGIVAVGHDAQHGGNEVATGLEQAVHSLDRLAVIGPAALGE